MEKNANSIPMMLIGAGVFLIVAGLIYWAAQGKLQWIGRLPGDIRIEKENFTFFAPITTMILLSVVLSVLLRVFRHFFP